MDCTILLLLGTMKNIYIADSTRQNSNIHDKNQYNRKLTYEQFEDIWSTDIYPVKNVYVTVD